MTKLTGAALDRALANALGVKSVHDCEKWVGLTDGEISKIIDAEIGFNSCWGPEEQFARAIEAKLKEKNA